MLGQIKRQARPTIWNGQNITLVDNFFQISNFKFQEKIST